MPDNFARDLSDLEACNMIMVKTQLRESFIAMNTGPMPEWENVAGTAEWQKIHLIRYGGIDEGPNRFAL